MDTKDYFDLKIRYQDSDIKELEKIVNAPAGEYRDEAVLAARDALLSRLPKPDVSESSSAVPQESLGSSLSEQTYHALEELIRTAPEPPRTIYQILYGWSGRMDDSAFTTYVFLSILGNLVIMILLGWIVTALDIKALIFLPAIPFIHGLYIFLALKCKRDNDIGEDDGLAKMLMSYGRYSGIRSGVPYPTQAGLPYATSRKDWHVNASDPELPFLFRNQPLRILLASNK